MTMTEKVDESKHGWEMWVADESLMTTTDYNKHSKDVVNSSDKDKETVNSNNTKKTINFNNSFNNMKESSQEGSLTGIGSLANYKPLHPSSSNEQQQQPPQAEPVTQQHKPQSPPSTNTLGLVSSHRSESRKNPPSLHRPSTKGPGIPYAHAYELYGRHVTRVQPPSAHPHPQSGPYPNIPAPEKKAHPPPVAEVCLECMMRDRDMAGVDVLGPGAWARESDADYEEAMRAEATIQEQDSPDHYHGGADDSSNKASTSDAQQTPSEPQSQLKKRLGKGQLLTMPALKAWTQMNPPATAHRWRTLQLYLREQRHYLELERQAKRSIELENERTEELIRTNADNSLRRSTDLPSSTSNYQFLRAAPSRSKIGYRASSATLLTKGMALETLDVSKDEKAASKYRANENKLRSSSSTKRVPSSPPAHRSRSSRSPRSGAMNINSLSLSTDLLNQNDHLPPHSATHPTMSSSRAPSPTRFSFVSRKSAGFGESMRPFSSWARGRRSGSNSVLSLAPSGSLVDMHVGLSHDRHNLGSLPSPHGAMSKNRSMLNFHHTGGIPIESQYTHKPSLASLTSSPTTSRFNGLGDPRAGNQKKEKKKLRHTLKGLWNRLGMSRQRSCSIDQIGSPTPLGMISNRNRGHVRMNQEDEPLAPPPPLSALAREQQTHRRTRSTLSLPLASVCRFGSLRPQSVTTPHPGLDSTTSSPMSQNFIPPSPGSKLTFNGTGTTGHISTTYMHSPHDPQFDSLAEELEMVPSQRSSSSASRLKNRARSLGTMSLLSGVSGNEETNRKSKRKTITEPRKPHDAREPGNIDETGGPIDLHESQEEGAGVGMINTNGADPATQPNGNWASSTRSTPDKPSSVFTLMSRSSKMLSKIPGLKNRRASASGSIVLQSNSNNHTSTSINTTATPTPTTTNGRTDNLRSSISSTQFSSTIPPISDDHPPRDPDFQNPSPRLQQDPNLPQTYHHPIDRNDFLPLEKSRHTVSRSNDFLALRYISLGRDDRN